MNIETINKQLKSIELKINNAIDSEYRTIVREPFANYPLSFLCNDYLNKLKKINAECDKKLAKLNAEKQKLLEQLKETEDGAGELL